MTSLRPTLIGLFLVALLVTPAVAQSPSAKTQAVFAASQLEERCATAFTKYDRMKEAGRLMELDGSDRPLHLGIVGSLQHELDMALTTYFKAIDSGWKASDAELTKARETIQAMQKRMEQVGLWTCLAWDEARLPDGARGSFHKIRNKAWEGVLLAQVKNIDESARMFAFARELIQEHGEAIDRELDAGRDVVDTRKHPAYARMVAEVDRLQASVQGSLDAVTGERDQLVADVGALAAAAEKAEPFFREIGNAGSLSGSEEAIIAAIGKRREKIDAFRSGPEAEVKAALAKFTGKYGADRDAIGVSVTKIMGGKALDVPHTPGFLVDQINRGLTGVEEARTGLVAELLDIGRRNSKSEVADPARRDAAFAMARSCLTLALEIDPGNSEAQKILDGLGAGAAAADEKASAALDQGTWDDHSGKFQGPGSAGSLASSAQEWLAADPGWSKDKDVIAVRVNGDWVVAERDRDGNPVTWGLPVEAAFVRDTDRDAGRDVAFIFRLTMVTRENDKSPPWKMARVGSTRQMRASNVSASSKSSGGPNPVFRLVLVIALLASGLLLVESFVQAKVPALSGLYGVIVPLRPIIGVATLGIGVVLLVLGLLSPISDILPQAAAIVAGLFLGLELLLRKGSGSAVGKAQELLAAQEEKIRKIGKYQVPLGVACLVLALIHMFAAQMTLF
ncbi:MAG: hypothetical protein ABFS86_18155 [Planctomycetota bacterium]